VAIDETSTRTAEELSPPAAHETGVDAGGTADPIPLFETDDDLIVELAERGGSVPFRCILPG